MKTVKRMASNRADKASVIYPAEIGRAEWSLVDPPSAVGLKLLLLAVSAVGEAVADDILHELPMSLLRQVPGLAGMSKNNLEQVLSDLSKVRARLDIHDPTNPKIGVLDYEPLLFKVGIKYSDDAVMSWHVRFGDVLRDMVAASELFAVIDRALALSMKSRYSLLLYQFVATHWRKKHVHQIKLPLADLRRIFALEAGSYPQFKALNQRVISAAVSEISAASPYSLTAKPYFEGSRAVAGIVLSWEAKANDKPTEAVPATSRTQGTKPEAGNRKPSASAAVPKASSEAKVLAFHADLVKRKAPGVSTAVSSTMARRLLAADLVSQADLRAAGLPVC